VGVLARGSVSDRPWGMTLGALGMRGLTGELVLTAADAKQYRVAFDQGAVVAAYSPMVADAAVRLALTGNLITSSQVSELTRRLAAAPDRDEVDVIAELCRLQPEHAQRLRRRLVAQRAARTFSVEQGQFVVEDRVMLTVVEGSALDVRAVLFMGARNNISDDRLAAELAQLGVWFKLKPDAVNDLAQYGFTEEEKPVLQMLLQGANVADMEAVHVELGVRVIRAIAYSLASCGACEASLAPKPSSVPIPARTRTPSPPVPSRTTSSSVAGPMPTRASSNSVAVPIPSRTTSSSVAGPMPSRTSSSSSSIPVAGSSRAHSSTVPPQTVMRPRGTTMPPPNAPPSATVRTPGTTTPPQTTAQGTNPPGHKTAPLGSRSPMADGRSGSPSQPPDGAAPAGPRTITQSSGVPRPTTSSGSAGMSAASRSPSGGMPRQDRSPSGGVPYQDRSPSGGTSYPTERAASASGAIPRQTGTHHVARPHSSTGRALSQTTPPMPRTRTQSSGPTGLRPPAGAGSGINPPTSPPRRPSQMPRRPKQNTASTLEIEALLQKKIPMIDQGADYYTLFGLQVGASPEEIRSTYFMLARKLHPDRLAAIGVDDDQRQAQRLMACINAAFAVLNDPVRREEYLSILRRGGEAAVRAEEQKADELAMRVMRAEEEFRQGEMALRREQLQQAVQHFSQAVELQPNEPEYQALLAWARFAAAADKQGIATQTRKAIRAAEANDNSPTAHFYLGRVERMLGREKEALAQFHEVLRIKPTHSEASSEARILEQRLKGRR